MGGRQRGRTGERARGGGGRLPGRPPIARSLSRSVSSIVVLSVYFYGCLGRRLVEAHHFLLISRAMHHRARRPGPRPDRCAHDATRPRPRNGTTGARRRRRDATRSTGRPADEIVGLYHANELLGDTSLPPIALSVADKIEANAAEESGGSGGCGACVLQVVNARLEAPSDHALSGFGKLKGKGWSRELRVQLDDPNTLSVFAQARRGALGGRGDVRAEDGVRGTSSRSPSCGCRASDRRARGGSSHYRETGWSVGCNKSSNPGLFLAVGASSAEAIEGRVAEKLVDFDDHFESVANDWRNVHINELCQNR